MSEKKLTKKMILDAIGKSPESKEFQEIINTLGKPEDIECFDENCYYAWDTKGIEISFEKDSLDNVKIFIEPNDDYPYSAKNFIDINDWHYDLDGEELINIYGEPQRFIKAEGYSELIQNDTEYRIIYQDKDKRVGYSFTPKGMDFITEIDIGLPMSMEFTNL